MCLRHSIGAALCLLVFASWAVFYHPKAHPSDDALTGIFQSKRSEFERLVKMTDEDSNVRGLGRDYVEFNDYKRWPEDGESRFSRQRWSQYQGLFNRLDSAAPYQSARVEREDGLVLVETSIGVVAANEYEHIVTVKGLAYSREPLRETVDSLDELGFESMGTFYKRIDDHWYLYFDGGWTHGE